MNSTRYPDIAIIGLGMWGKKLTRVATELGIPTHGFDLDINKAKWIKHHYPTVRIHDSIHEITRDKHITAVLIATPPPAHYELAKTMLSARKHVLIEKPMTQQVNQARSLVCLADKTRRILMVDHTYLFSPALIHTKELLAHNVIGKIHRIKSVRLGSRIIPDSTVLWDFASHDIAISEYLTGQRPINVRTKAAMYHPGSRLNKATIELLFSNNIQYKGLVSWNHPTKERTLTIIGESGSFFLCWNGKNESLTLKKPQRSTIIIPASKEEPLRAMLHHFIQSVRTGNQPISNGKTGLEVVKILVALHSSWKRNGVQISL